MALFLIGCSPQPAPGSSGDAGSDGGATIRLHVEPYTLAPGAETVECVALSPYSPAMHLAGYDVRERFGMHHMTLYSGACDGAMVPLFLVQRQHESATMGNGAPEYVDATLEVPAGTIVAKVHALNATPEPVTIEAWIDLRTRNEATMPVSLLSLSAGNEKMAVPAHSKQTYHAAMVAPRDVTVLQLVGHTHSHTTEQRASVGSRQVYSSRNWSEPTPVWFTSQTAPLIIRKGETLSWECDIDNTTDAILGYAERVDTAEMCNLTGLVLGPTPWLGGVP